jgi:crossover junction endodeoxyribonuclease RuvC
MSKILLSIDPGYERVGIAILSKNERGVIHILHSECFKTEAAKEFVDRLVLLGKHIGEIIKKYEPKTLAIENLFMQNNQKTVMKVSEARGVLLYVARVFNLSVFELTPLQIKAAVTGSGRSDKTSVQKMVKILLPEIKNKIKIIDDEYDALACGLAYFALEKSL